MKKLTARDADSLYRAILSLKDLGEARRFFRDLLTSAEMNEFARRWKAARMLADGVPYTRIVDETGLSSTTVARVSRWVKKGTGGYRLIIKRLSGAK